jgi:hypothetical protein
MSIRSDATACVPAANGGHRQPTEAWYRIRSSRVQTTFHTGGEDDSAQFATGSAPTRCACG